MFIRKIAPVNGVGDKKPRDREYNRRAPRKTAFADMLSERIAVRTAAAAVKK